jgi:hypothetical protein
MAQPIAANKQSAEVRLWAGNMRHAKMLRPQTSPAATYRGDVRASPKAMAKRAIVNRRLTINMVRLLPAKK